MTVQWVHVEACMANQWGMVGRGAALLTSGGMVGRGACIIN